MWVRKCQEAEVSNDYVGLPDRPAGAIQFNGYLFDVYYVLTSALRRTQT